MLKMDSRNSYILECDVCNMTTGIPACDHAEAWSRGQGAGWTVRKDDPDVIHVCARCANKEEAENENRN